MYTEEQFEEYFEKYGNDEIEVPDAVSLVEDWYDLGDPWQKNPHVVLDGKLLPVQPLELTGGMDKGSDMNAIFEIEGIIYRKNGFYASHYGTDWDGPLDIVKEYEVKITKYLTEEEAAKEELV